MVIEITAINDVGRKIDGKLKDINPRLKCRDILGVLAWLEKEYCVSVDTSHGNTGWRWTARRDAGMASEIIGTGTENTLSSAYRNAISKSLDFITSGSVKKC